MNYFTGEVCPVNQQVVTTVAKTIQWTNQIKSNQITVVTCSRHKARENVCKQVRICFHLTFDWKTK